MQTASTGRIVASRLLVAILAVALVFTMMPLGSRSITYAAEGGFTVQTPALVITGQGMLGGEAYSAANVSQERSYSLDELKAMQDVTGEMYSSKKTQEPYTKSYFIADGVSLSALLGDVVSGTEPITALASDGYECSFKNDAAYSNGARKQAIGLGSGRYFYDGFGETATKEVPAILSWAYTGVEGTNGEPPALEDKPTAAADVGKLRLLVGQVGAELGGAGAEDMNQALYNGNSKVGVETILVGDSIDQTALTIGSKAYTRAEVLLMDFAENSYTYSTDGGSATDYVRGVPMSVLLAGYNNNDVVTFAAADGYDVAATGYTVKQLIDNDYMLAYEKGTNASDLAGIYETAKKDPSKYGCFRLYGSDENGKPAKLVNQITVTSASGEDFSNSPYKHITNGGQGGSAPYNIDAITGATLTVEGPGVEKSVPVSVRDLEGRDAGIRRADYTDQRSGVPTTRKYEGIDLNYILTKMNSGDNGIKMTGNAAKVQIKNRNRNTIAEFSVKQVEEASKTDTPIMVAYGTATSDGTNIRPFVFDNGEGADKTLGNEDGCIKLVYNKDAITGDANADYTTFGNMAYIYVAEESTPGYKHDKDPYQSADISNYVLTVTGDKIGREVNYTVKQLEDMVKYGENGKPDNNGMGYRDEYSLANSTYWYVNEYEGVQLWKLLLRSGLPESYKTDNETIVSSTATDGYAATDKFTTRQVADPDSFGFYEKNPADLNDGKYEGNENLRQGNDVSTGDKLRTGYPVLVAYGVNGYPYVEKASQEGYLSGLQNDGGPLRIISGKKQYNHANGSNQAKLLDKVLVGDNTYHYSTHKYHSKDVYQQLAGSKLQVNILNGPDADAPVIKDGEYSVGDLEDLIYGGKLTATQLGKARIKDFYGVTKNGNVYSDLYEGVDLQYFLTDVVEIPGYKGTITFSNGSKDVSMNLEDVLKASGSNGDTGKSGLRPVLAYGKNGSPMVATKEAADGYEDKVTLAEGTEYENSVTVKNNGGPLQLTFPTIDGNADLSEVTLTGINAITIHLSADKYAHTKAPYDTYQNNAITISGEGTRLTEAKNFTVAELEGKQTLAFTGDYSILKSGEGQTASQARYRGIDLYALLTSTAVGLKSNADKVIIETTDGKTKEFALSEIRGKYKNTLTGDEGLPVILAYGSGKAGDADKEDGLPLVTDKDSEGYDADYANNGGPIRLVVGQTETGDVNSGKNVKDIKSITVTASEMTSWNHNVSEIYKQYLTETVNLQVVDKEGKELFNKDYTVGDIEEQTSLIEQMKAKTTQEDTWEGINFWKFVKQEAGSVDGIDDPIKIDVTAADGFSKELRSIFGMDALRDGVKDGETYVPIILAYGVNGAPLVIGDKTYPNGEGYDATAGNNGGPIRLVTHNNQGASLTYVKKIRVTVGESAPAEGTKGFVIKGLSDKDVELSAEDISKLTNAAGDKIGQAEATYTYKKGTDKVKGVSLQTLLAAQGVELENTKITLNATDGYEETEGSYKGITLKDAAKQNYFVAHQVWNSETNAWEAIADADKTEQATVSTIRIYRNYNEAQGNEPTTDWRNRCTNISGITLELPEVTKFKEYATSSVRSAALDPDNTLWVGTYGGGLFCKDAGNRSFRVLNTKSDPALKTDFTSGAAADADGGIWVSQNASYTDPSGNQGVLYIKDGNVTQYTAEDSPATIADNYVQAIKVDTDGKVWFGSFGGLTIYDPQADTWTTYSKADKDFPATSINTITLDGEGGAWLGFYPDGAGTEADPYTGGFCHIDKNGVVSEKNVVTGEMTADGSTSKLAQVWVRSIAIDQKKTVWVVASGTNLQENEGGTIWKLKNGTGTPTKYTGDEVLGDYLDGSATTEVRVVAVDNEGSLWFGTSADGVLKVSNPKLNEGKFDVDAQYAKETGSWSSANRNNIYYIGFMNDGTAYVGSAGGLQVLGDEPASDKESVGGESVDSAALVVDGRGVSKNGYFSVKSLKNAEGVKKVDATYRWMNKSGSVGHNDFQGVCLDNLLKDVVGIKDEVRYITVITEDGKEKQLDLDEIEAVDLDGNKPMIAWQSDEDPDNTKIDPKLVLGQMDRSESNKGSWLKNVVEIRVDMPTAIEAEQYEAIDEIVGSVDLADYSAENKAQIIALTKTAKATIKSAKSSAAITAAKSASAAAIEDIEKKEVLGDKTRETADFIVEGDGVLKNGFFNVKSLKNAEGIKGHFTDAAYKWKDAQGGSGETEFQGVSLKTLFEVHGLNEEASSFTVITTDGQETKYGIDEINVKDQDGNEPIIAWSSSENSKLDLTLVIGPSDSEDANKERWISVVKEIRVDLPTEVELAQDAAAGEIESYADPADYDKPEQADLAEAIADAVFAIRAADTLSKVEDALAAGKEAIDQIKTSEQKAQELAEAKADAADAIDAAAKAAKDSLKDMTDKDAKKTAEDRIDKTAAAAKSRIDEIGKIENVAPIAAEAVQSIDDIAADTLSREADAKAAAEEKALAEKKSEAIQSVMDYLNENKDQMDPAAATQAALDAVLAITGAKDAEGIDAVVSQAKTSFDTLVAEKAAADAKAAAASRAAEEKAAAQQTASAQKAYKAAVRAAKAKMMTVKRFKVKAKKGKKAKLSWKKVKNADGYEIYRSTKKNGKYKLVKTITKASKVKITNKKLKAKKKYYYKIRPYRLVKDPTGKMVKVYGKFSAKKKIKAKK
ncbi:MAG: hypothetical protein IJ109_00950 [Firmicutes bacterium]|nr:hypothetical protein [Bacillota bacterium]